MNTKNPIPEVLKVTQSHYNWKTLELFHQWCGMRSANNMEFQNLISSKVLYNWFLNELDGIELQFYDRITTTVENHVVLYNRMTQTILTYSPPTSLIRSIIKTGLPNIINEISLN